MNYCIKMIIINDVTRLYIIFATSVMMTGCTLNTLHGRRPYNIAHRGSSGILPENTVMAHQMAIEEGKCVLVQAYVYV